jgi:hypothetical protein
MIRKAQNAGPTARVTGTELCRCKKILLTIPDNAECSSKDAAVRFRAGNPYTVQIECDQNPAAQGRHFIIRSSCKHM